MRGVCCCIVLEQWLIERFGVSLDGSAVGGPALADAFGDALGAAGFDYDAQVGALLECAARGDDMAFAEACLDRAERIERLQQRRREALLRHRARCQSRGGEKRTYPPADTVAPLRFSPLWPATDEVADIVHDMLRRLVAEGYLPPDEAALRDLRQGLGYYRRGEDPWRLRRPVRWLGGMKALHFWIDLLATGDHPLIGIAPGAPPKWVTAASLFTDRQGRAVTNRRIEHGEVSSPGERQRIERTVPRPPTGLIHS